MITLLRLSPLVIYYIIWLFQILLYFVNPYGYLDIHVNTWILIGLSITTLTVGYLTFFFINKNDRNIDGYDLWFFKDLKAIRIILFIAFLISFISIIGLLYYLVDYSNGINGLLKNPLDYRNLVTKLVKESTKEWNPVFSLLNYLNSFNYIAAILGGIYFVSTEKHRFFGFLPILNSLLFSAITLQRYNFIFIFSIWIFTFFFTITVDQGKGKFELIKKIKRYLVLFVIIIILMVVSIIMLRVDYSKDKVDYLLTFRYAIKSIYTYVAGNIVALDRFIEKDIDFLYGMSIFRGIIKWFARFNIYESDMIKTVYNEFTNITKSGFYLNTYTYIRPFYEDFGIFGLLINNYIFGLLGSFSVEKLLEKPTLLRINFAALIFFSYLMTFFNFAFLNITMFVYFTALIFLSQMYIDRKIVKC